MYNVVMLRCYTLGDAEMEKQIVHIFDRLYSDEFVEGVAKILSETHRVDVVVAQWGGTLLCVVVAQYEIIFRMRCFCVGAEYGYNFRR